MTVRILVGDCRTRLARLPASSIDCCVTSPPYWGLRDYGIPGQIGLEARVEDYVARLVGVFRQVRRVMADGGTLWLNLGDTYASGGRRTRDPGQSKLHRAFVGETYRDGLRPADPPGIKPKDLIGIPWMLAFALRADGWYLRQDVIWHKPNPCPESVVDRCTRAHEYVFLLTKSRRYHYDAAAIREPCVSRPSDIRKMLESRERIGGKHKHLIDPLNKVSAATNIGRKRAVGSPEGRNRRSVWTIATQPFRGAHFATFPPALVEPCIKAGCPAGGWVLDPFGGAATTGLVAQRLGRNAIVIELNRRYAALARKRLGS
ncbi:MAG: site-specific DNA-methyltransferase [Nevskia sp.]|nr:site-specific DNA-methyltransferase [Nevskia sp.]